MIPAMMKPRPMTLQTALILATTVILMEAAGWLIAVAFQAVSVGVTDLVTVGATVIVGVSLQKKHNNMHDGHNDGIRLL